MEALYMGCLVGGVLFAVVSVLIGDIFGNWIDGMLDFLHTDFLQTDFLKPVVLASGVTGFGGAGLLLDRYSGLVSSAVLLLAIAAALALCVLVYFAYVKPMQSSENSTGYSESEMAGKIGEITIPVPPEGFGEVMVRLVGGNTLHIAASWDKWEIPAGTSVVVIDVRDGILYVSELDERKRRG